jgi:hypothetical protein
VRGQDADHGAGVVQLTPQDGVVGLVKVDPADRHTLLLALADEALVILDVGEIP